MEGQRRGARGSGVAWAGRRSTGTYRHAALGPSLVLAGLLCASGCASPSKSAASAPGGGVAGAGGVSPAAPAGPAAPGALVVDDPQHAIHYVLPPVEGGWKEGQDSQSARGAKVEAGSFPLTRPATAVSCRDTARSRLAALQRRAEQDDADAAEAAARAGDQNPATPPLDGPRDQAVADTPAATWSFTRGSATSAVRSRWAFFARGFDCLMLEVTGPLGDPAAEAVFSSAVLSVQVQPLPPDKQRDVDLVAGMRFLEQREPSAALERFEALAQREPGLARAHFGALMAGYELGPATYQRALPHGLKVLEAERELSSEQRQLALRAVGVMQLAQNQLRPAAATLAELVVRSPELAEGQYNYACALARLGDARAAIDHLKEAVSLDRSLASHARDDDDLAGLRGSAPFEELVRPADAGKGR